MSQKLASTGAENMKKIKTVQMMCQPQIPKTWGITIVDLQTPKQGPLGPPTQ